MKARATGRRTSGPTTKRLTRLMLSTGLLIGATGTVGLVAHIGPCHCFELLRSPSPTSRP